MKKIISRSSILICLLLVDPSAPAASAQQPMIDRHVVPRRDSLSTLDLDVTHIEVHFEARVRTERWR